MPDVVATSPSPGTGQAGPQPGLDPTVPGDFLRAVGLVGTEVSPTVFRGHLDASSRHHTPWGIVHGGLYTTVIESAASLAASHAVRERGQFAVGVNNQTDFLRPHVAGRLDVLATPIQQGRTLQLWLVELRNEAGKLVARGQVRLANQPLPTTGPYPTTGPSPTTGRSPHTASPRVGGPGGASPRRQRAEPKHTRGRPVPA